MVKEDVDLHGRLEEAEIKTFLRGYGEKFQAAGPPLRGVWVGAGLLCRLTLTFLLHTTKQAWN
jgi:hypothetical protein